MFVFSVSVREFVYQSSGRKVFLHSHRFLIKILSSNLKYFTSFYYYYYILLLILRMEQLDEVNVAL